jgi:hypothetical protein
MQSFSDPLPQYTPDVFVHILDRLFVRFIEIVRSHDDVLELG